MKDPKEHIRKYFNFQICSVLLCLFLCGLYVGSLQAQESEEGFFIHDSTAFFEQVSSMLKEARKKDANEFLDRFEPVWFGGYFTDEIRQKVYITADLMYEKNMLPFPDFHTYLNTVTTYVTSGQDLELFDVWHKAIDELQKKRSTREFKSYLRFSEKLFTENALHKSLSTYWRTTSSAYKFEYTTEPRIRIDSLDLYCYSRGDSAVIYNTKGVLYPLRNLWEGDGGTVNWHRSGFSESELLAELKSYQIEVNKSYYEADSVEFKNTIYFGNAKLMGNLLEKVEANVKEKNAHFPKFDSYDERLQIKNIIPNVDFEGGYRQKGRSFIGSGTGDNKAKLTMYRNGKPFMMAYSKAFGIRPEKITALVAEIIVFLGDDTLRHPGVNFTLNTIDRKVILYRNDVGVQKNPFYNTYHQVDMHVETVTWSLDGNWMQFGPLINNSNTGAVMESFSFFDYNRFDAMYGLGMRHPLVIIENCVKENETLNLTVGQIAKSWRLPITQVRPMLMLLSTQGFLQYEFGQEDVTVSSRVHHYVHSMAKYNGVDYDILQLNSLPPPGVPNAELNLDTLNMEVNATQSINLSDSHQVYIFPKKGELTLKKNRDFDFSGRVQAGRLIFYGEDFQFEYDSFIIRMPHIDSMRIYVETEEKDRYGRPVMRQVRTVIEKINGLLEIDKPNNKAGKIPVKFYPRFTSYEKSYAYYDKKEVVGGVYDRGKFRFELEPFVFDSLDNFRNDQIEFDGDFKSGGIFPNFEQTLRLQKDFSLGFEHQTPPEGMPMYGGKGVFYNNILLSHDGLKGDGFVEYITSTTQSSSFLFFPDSANAPAQNFVIEEQYPGPPEYPAATGKDIEWHWYPQDDTMRVIDRMEPFRLYDGDSKYQGTLIYSKDSLVGGAKGDQRGHFEFDKAVVESNLLRFKFSTWDSDTADFSLKTGSLGELGFKTVNMRCHVDFSERKGYFYSNGGFSIITFEPNQYIARMDKFIWEMDNDIVEMSGKSAEADRTAGGIEVEGAKLTSTHKDQDSLSFSSKAARYDLNKEIIQAEEVQFIEVADALIVPDSSRVTVLKDAVIKTLKNAEIIANSISKYHTIYDAVVDIKGKQVYNGNGKYDYVDENDDIQVITFKEVYADKFAQSRGNGTIIKDDNFKLSNNFKFYGSFEMAASEQELTFNGYTQMEHACSELEKPWFTFESAINPQEVLIPIDTNDNVDKDGKMIANGPMLTPTPTKLYPTFVNTAKDKKDIVTAYVGGFLKYDASSRSYLTSSFEKLNTPELSDDIYTLNTETCQLELNGAFTFGADLGRVDMTPMGSISIDPKKDEYFYKTSLLIDFFFENKALEMIAKELQENADYEVMNFEDSTFRLSLNRFVGDQRAEELFTELNFYGKVRKNFPEELEKSMFITGLNLQWNFRTLSFQSVGPFAIVNLLDKQVYKVVNGNIELKHSKAGDRLSIYIKSDNDTWYFFNYQNETMEAISSNKEFNQRLLDVKSGKNKLDRTKGQARYKFIPGVPAQRDQFLRKL